MWNIADIPMLVSKWTPILEDAQPEITKMPMWVINYKVPHSMFSWKGLGFLASKVGDPKRLHPETETCKNFEEAKVFVEVNMMKELPKDFTFAIATGKEETVEYTYPWLPPRCTTCGKWGHFEEGCQVSPQISILKRLNKLLQFYPKHRLLPLLRAAGLRIWFKLGAHHLRHQLPLSSKNRV